MNPTPAKRAKPARSRRTRPQPARRRVLRLFVAGATEGSRRAIVRVRELCAAEPAGSCTLEVIDIYQQPALARAHQIVATPTLIMDLPLPVRRFIGSLTNLTGLFAEPIAVAVVRTRP